MANDFSLTVGKVLNLTVVVEDPEILGPLLAWQNKDQAKLTDAGKKMVDNPIAMGLSLQAIGLVAPMSGDIERARQLLAELRSIIGEPNGY